MNIRDIDLITIHKYKQSQSKKIQEISKFEITTFRVTIIQMTYKGADIINYIKVIINYNLKIISVPRASVFLFVDPLVCELGGEALISARADLDLLLGAIVKQH